MIGLNNLKPAIGSRHRRKIVGRGEGSGHGGSSTRGRKGQTARSGDKSMGGFEGGQMPLVRRIPKRGFTSKFRNSFEIVNLDLIDKRFALGTEVTAEKLKEIGFLKKSLPVKILGKGELTKALTIKANAFSATAMEKIKNSGGTAVKI